MTIKKQDSFKNFEKGLGGSKDTNYNMTYSRDRFLDYQTLNDLYATDWLAASVVDTPIDEAYREGRLLTIEDQEKRTTFEDALDAFGVDDKFSKAAKWARAFGGAGIIMIFDNQKLEEPLEVDKITQGSLKNLILVDRFELFPQDVNTTNILEPNFLEPTYYTVAQGKTKIHASRIIKFDGTVTTNREKTLRNYFGASIFDRGFKAISEAQTSSDLISNLLFQSNVDVTKIEGLNDLLADGSTELAMERIRIASRMKSNLNMLVLDGKDSYENIAKNFSGLAELDSTFFQKVSGAFKIPATKLLGKSAQGMNATGEGDLKNYYDMVRSEIQTNLLSPKYTLIDQVLSMHLFGEDIGVYFEWESLWQMSDGEKATIELNRSQADNNYLLNNVITELDIKARLAEEGTYPTITQESVAEEIALMQDLDKVDE